MLKSGHRPALDGLRGIAIAAVLLYHAGGIAPGGYLGVDLFFVLSGFLITTLLVGEYSDRGAVSFGGFYRRRARRLLPALACVLAAFVAVTLAVDGALARQDLVGLAAGIGYLSNLLVMGEPATRAMPDALRHLWSLAAEEQFYLLWPPILVLLLRGRTRLALAVVTAGVALMSLRGAELWAEGASLQRLQFGIDSRSVAILVGCALALVLAGHESSPRARWAAPFVVTCVLGFFALDFGRELFLGPLLVFSLLCAALLVLALDDRSPLALALSAGALVFLGRISYALYLWHVPVFVALGVTRQEFVPEAVLAIALSVGLAVASYYLVERRFLRPAVGRSLKERLRTGWLVSARSVRRRGRQLSRSLLRPTFRGPTPSGDMGSVTIPTLEKRPLEGFASDGLEVEV
jgi:peptidoglycan/LPS O-acetylase OafA/YrhL